MLTDKQKAILDFINSYIEMHQFPPSVREIGKQFGIYPATVQDHISALERKGYLQKKRFQSRSISVPAPSRPLRQGSVPVVGRVAAGAPLLAQENIEEVVHFPPEWAPTGAFLLKVQGDSMIDAHILNGDYVLVHPGSSATHGEIVVALLGEEATVKRFMKTEEGIFLKAENPKFKPIPVVQDETESFRIVGKVMGVLRIMRGGAKI
jgi:repressor LexA